MLTIFQLSRIISLVPLGPWQDLAHY